MLNTISALFIGFCPITLVLVIGYLCYQYVAHNTLVIIIFTVLMVCSFFLGYFMYKEVKRKGVLKFMTQLYGSPELDKGQKE